MSTSNRTRRWLQITAVSALMAGTLYFLFGFSPETWVDNPGLKANSMTWRLSISLAYTTLAFFTATLVIGPLNVLRGRPNPTHNPLRRDLGIATALLGITHMSVGMFVHTRGFDPLGLFFHNQASPGNPLGLHLNFFGAANLAGLFQLTLLIFLLVISNNIALRSLGLQRWKFFQRGAYLVLISVALHGYSYQRIEQRLAWLQVIFWGFLAVIIILQLSGVLVRKREKKQG